MKNVAAWRERLGCPPTAPLVPQKFDGWRSAVRTRESEPPLSFVALASEGASSLIASGSAAIVAQTGDLTIRIPANVNADHKAVCTMIGEV